ncbi:hypothetical protein EVAR_24139_1 [Eumeta japonica]|uniref:Mariner Mos1 transposase n=1 Tax=Eumeta variegata TaxID=151549 RepID=A0A4C1YR72_EUMVA|nr:hypothetical protein EVAR_24139_1 [Eumeta japonica]
MRSKRWKKDSGPFFGMTAHYATIVLEDKKQSPQTGALTIVCLWFWKKFGEKQPRNKIIHDDNASPHSARQTTNYLGTCLHEKQENNAVAVVKRTARGRGKSAQK